jgi:hypothetical protein
MGAHCPVVHKNADGIVSLASFWHGVNLKLGI